MSTLTALLLGVGCLAVDFAYLIWDDHIRRIPLSEFGIEAVQRIGSLKPPEWRDRVWQRGWMTFAEWREVNRKHSGLRPASKL